MDSVRSDDAQRSSSRNNNLKACILRSLASCFFILSTFWASTLGQERQYAFNYSIIQGSGSSELHAVLDDSVVQRLLLDIASQPRTEEYVNAALRGTNVTSKQLLGYELVRRQEGAYIVNFLLFTKDDERRMREITESHAHALANAILNRRAEVESILKEYELPPVDPRAALFIILGCFSLDWDGLALTAEKGYRNVPSFFERIFPRRIIHGWESTDLSRRGFYKGSHNTSYGSAMLTSFGDHEIQPRHAFPDVLWSQSHLPDSLKSKIAELARSSSEKALGKEVGAMMLALRQGGQSLTVLAKAADIGQDRALKLADLLIELGYIQREGNNYLPRVPVLALSDSSIVRRIRYIGRVEMENWCASEYKRLQQELSGLTPFRYGVKQSDFFYDIWHDIFGAANRILVESGLFADPYLKLYGGRGIIPVVFATSLYEDP